MNINLYIIVLIKYTKIRVYELHKSLEFIREVCKSTRSKEYTVCHPLIHSKG